MRPLTRVLVAIAFSAVGLADAAVGLADGQPNILKNSHFAIAVPADWTRDAFLFSENIFSYDQNKKIVDISIPSNQPNDARWTQTVSVESNTDYILSGFIATKDVQHSSESVQAGANLSILDDLPGTGFFTFSDPLFGDNGFTFRELRFNTGSNTTIRVALRVGMFSGTTTGTALFRNIKLVRAQ